MKRNNDYDYREIAGEAMLIPIGPDAGIGGIVTLNGTAAVIWKLLGERCDRDFVLSRLLETYETGGKDAAEALDAFLAELKEKKLLLD